MANIEKHQFPDLDITGTNYISWATNVELHLESHGLSKTIKEINISTAQEKAKSVIFLRRHLDKSIIHDYAHIRNPKELWKSLKDRFDHQKDINIPLAGNEWQSLRSQDFDKVMNYIPAILGIVALLIAEKNNELLIKNHKSRPSRSKTFHEMNVMDVKNPKRENKTFRGRGHRINCGRGKIYNPSNRNSFQWVRSEQIPKGKEVQASTSKIREDICFRCGTKGHLSKACQIPEHLCTLYKDSAKGKGKEVNSIES